MNITHLRRITLILLATGAIAAAQDRPFPESLVRWQIRPESPVFRGQGGEAWDRKIRERGWILVRDGVSHLWYTGYNDDRSGTRFLGHATSRDGLRWERDPANPIFEGGWVEDVCVVPDGSWLRMFAEGKGDIAHQLVSQDGVRWVPKGPLRIRTTKGAPIAPGPYGTPTVWVENGQWSLFYERGDRGVWLARSTDPERLEWTNVSDEPVLACGPDPYDREAVALNQIVKRDGEYYAYYHANSTRPWADWTTCVARSRDLIHWEKYAGNPIVQQNASSAILVDPDADGPLPARLYTMHPEVRVYENTAP